jgi:hypothetical protein
MKLFPHQEKALELTKGMNLVAYYIDMGGGKTFIGGEKMDDLEEFDLDKYLYGLLIGDEREVA